VLFAKYNQNDEVEKGEMDEYVARMGRRGPCIGYSRGKETTRKTKAYVFG
jgi:hypothetical protein